MEENFHPGTYLNYVNSHGGGVCGKRRQDSPLLLFCMGGEGKRLEHKGPCLYATHLENFLFYKGLFLLFRQGSKDIKCYRNLFLLFTQ